MIQLYRMQSATGNLSSDVHSTEWGGLRDSQKRYCAVHALANGFQEQKTYQSTMCQCIPPLSTTCSAYPGLLTDRTSSIDWGVLILFRYDDDMLRIWHQIHGIIYLVCQVGSIQGYSSSGNAGGTFSCQCLGPLVLVQINPPPSLSLSLKVGRLLCMRSLSSFFLNLLFFHPNIIGITNWITYPDNIPLSITWLEEKSAEAYLLHGPTRSTDLNSIRQH